MTDDPLQKSSGHHDVFISYAQEDKLIADAVCARLESRNIRCWIAPRDINPGKNFPEAIIEGIEEGKVLVVIFSSSANKSPHVTRELTHAVNKGRIIIPFRIEDVTPSKSMEYLIGVPHWLDAVTPPMEQHIDRLVGTVEHIIGKRTVTAVPPVTADTAASLPVPKPVPQETPEEPSPGQIPKTTPGIPIPKDEAKESPGSPPSSTVPVRNAKVLAAAGIGLAVVILLSVMILTGVFSLPTGLNASGTAGTSSAIDYRSSDALVNTVVLTVEPTQTLAKDTELYIDANKDNSNAMVTVTFNGGPGTGLLKDNRVILTRSDGTETGGTLNFNQRLSEVKLQGTRGTDRIRVIVTLYSGSEKTIVDKLLYYRTYRSM
jgi:hypothetical protein